MKSLIPLLFITLASAMPAQLKQDSSSLVQRDLAGLTAALNDIGAAVDKTTTAVGGWTGDKAALDPIMKTAEDIMTAMKKAATDVSAMPALGVLDAAGMIGPAGTLASKVDGVTSAILAKQAGLAKIQSVGTVTKMLETQRAAADELQKAIMSKMPGLVSGIAAPIAGQFTQKLDAAISSLKGGGTASAGGAADAE